MARKDMQFTQEEMALEFQRFSRTPFRKILVLMLGGAPTPERIAEFAAKSPDRWAQACAIFGRLSGYSDKVEVEHTIDVFVHKASDVELMRRIEEVEAQLVAKARKQIDAERTVIEDAEICVSGAQLCVSGAQVVASG